MAFDEFGSLLSRICLHTQFAAPRPLFWTLIANPKAGGFTIKSRWKQHHADLLESIKKAEMNPLRENCGPSQTAQREGGQSGGYGLVPTTTAGHARKITDSLIKEASLAAAGQGNALNRPFHIIITAGGDGTSLEALTSLFHAPEEIRRDFAILRLPMGTGNDGSDAWKLDKALELIVNKAELQAQKALKLITAGGKGPFLAFNILSVGLDAFVTHMTNKMKGKLPGDSYKLWVDIAALFYDRLYKVGYFDVRAMDKAGNEVINFREKLLLLAVGESGRRTYGSHKWILPDERNMCAIKQMPLIRKLSLKEQFKHGTHIKEPEAKLWNAERVEFTSEFPLLAQMDGETVLLEKEDFPAVIELTPPVIPILKIA